MDAVFGEAAHGQVCLVAPGMAAAAPVHERAWWQITMTSTAAEAADGPAAATGIGAVAAAAAAVTAAGDLVPTVGATSADGNGGALSEPAKDCRVFYQKSVEQVRRPRRHRTRPRDCCERRCGEERALSQPGAQVALLNAWWSQREAVQGSGAQLLVSPEEQQTLAESTGIPPKIVEYWVGNMRKRARKLQQQQGGGEAPAVQLPAPKAAAMQKKAADRRFAVTASGNPKCKSCDEPAAPGSYGFCVPCRGRPPRDAAPKQAVKCKKCSNPAARGATLRLAHVALRGSVPLPTHWSVWCVQAATASACHAGKRRTGARNATPKPHRGAKATAPAAGRSTTRERSATDPSTPKRGSKRRPPNAPQRERTGRSPPPSARRSGAP
jgi:hypothetical protein